MSYKSTVVADSNKGDQSLKIWIGNAGDYNSAYLTQPNGISWEKQNSSTTLLYQSVDELIETVNTSNYIDFVGDPILTNYRNPFLQLSLGALTRFPSSVKIRISMSLNGDTTPVSLTDAFVAAYAPGNSFGQLIASNYTFFGGFYQYQNNVSPIQVTSTTPTVFEMQLIMSPGWSSLTKEIAVAELYNTVPSEAVLGFIFDSSTDARNLRIYAVDVVTTGDFNNIATGGVVCGGNKTKKNAVYSVIAKGGAIVGPHHDPVYYFDIASGGVLVGGRALRTYDNISSGGAVVAGSILSAIKYNPIAQGGAVIGTRVYEISGIGGAKVGGNALIDLIYNLPTSGGVLISGKSPLQPLVGMFDEYVDSGDYCSDYLSVDLTADQPDASFSLKFPGLDKIPLSVSVRMAASSSLCIWRIAALTLSDKNNVIVARVTTDDTVFCDRNTNEGCYWVAHDIGNGVLKWKLNEALCVSPCLCDSLPFTQADPRSIIDVLYSGCSSDFGLDTVLESYRIKGTAPNLYEFNLPIAIEYVDFWDLSEIYLQVDITIDDFNYDKTAYIYSLELDVLDDTGSGVIVNGLSINTFDEIAAGGVLVGGSDVELLIHLPIITGGVLVGGSDLDVIIYAPIITGGVLVGGNSTIVADYFIAMHGGIGAAGVAKLGDEEVGSGGVVCGGMKSTYYVFHIIPSNHKGVLAGGACTTFFIKTGTITGGAVVNGHQSVNVIYKLNTFGGCVVAGIAKFGVIGKNTVSGGVLINGLSVCNIITRLKASGGAVVGSTSIPTIKYNPIHSGGAVVGGHGNVNVYRDYRTITAGGVITDGDAIDLFKLYYRGSGEVITDGLATYDKEYIYGRCIASGKIIIDGVPEIIHDSYIIEANSGLILIGGRGEYHYNYLDRTCATENVLPCIAKFPNKYRECYISRFYLPEKKRSIPKSFNKNGAYVPAITFCQQGLFVPPPDSTFEPKG